jgi:hypothetical protein
MTSQAVLAARPKSASEGALAKIDPVAREARAEAPPKKARIEAPAKKARAEAPPPYNPDTRPTTYQQTLCSTDFLSRVIELLHFLRTLRSSTGCP